MRYHRIAWIDRLPELWAAWEQWFAELGETHTSLAVLTFFRSPSPHRSWVTAAGAVLDGASLAQSTLSIPWSPQAGVCIRSGYLALREIADYFEIPYDPDPEPGTPISIARQEFDAAYEEMASEGVPVRPDRERCWRDFAGWRVNYDARAARARRAHDGAVRAMVVGSLAAGPSVPDREVSVRPTAVTGTTELSHHSIPVVDACSHAEWKTSNAWGAPASST